MHVYFSGIGGTGISSLALIAHAAGYEVSGSDARPSDYLEHLKRHGISDIHIGVDDDFIAGVHAKLPIDWFVYGSAQPRDFPDHPEFAFCEKRGIKMSKRDEFLGKIIADKKLRLIAVAGTHGKTTTTAMAVWMFKELGLPVSYSGGAKLSFGDVGEFDPKSEYFVYEADEYDRNFLHFYPELSIITGVDWDHPDVYPTREDYYAAFRQFIKQSKKTVIWRSDIERLELNDSEDLQVIDEKDPRIAEQVKLAGLVNRQNAWQVVRALRPLLYKDGPRIEEKCVEIINRFPGVSRRFEEIAPNLYSDYAHTPAKIRGALQLAHEVAGDNLVVVYEGLHNTRQHFIKDDLNNLFDGVKQLYIAPSYLAREDPNLELLTPEKILDLLSNLAKGKAKAMKLDDNLKQAIHDHTKAGDLVLCLSAGGSGSLDEWLRKEFPN